MPKKEPIHDQAHLEKVDVLAPPRFEPTGEVKLAQDAITDGDWVGTFNLWLYTRNPEPSVLYQMRSPYAVWEPGKLDVAAGGHYSAGESGLDGMRELREELGITVPAEDVQYFGRRLFTSIDAKNRERKSVVTIYIAEYKGALEDMKLQEYEVAGIVRVSLKGLMQVFRSISASCKGAGYDPQGKSISYTVTASSFPYNFDDYQRKMAEFVALKLGVDNAYLGN